MKPTEMLLDKICADRTLVIGFMGEIGAGKTTSAWAYTEALGTNKPVAIRTFASPLKRGVKELFGFSESQVYGDYTEKNTVDERWGFSPREALQKVGTDCIRDMLCKDYFVRYMEIEIQKLFKEDVKVIFIDDVRKENEAQLVNKYGCVFKVERPGFKRTDSHKSENLPYHLCSSFVLYNNVTERDYVKGITSPDNYIMSAINKRLAL